MNSCSLDIAGDRRFSPGQRLRGEARWTLDHVPQKLAVRVVWRTQGKGTSDLGIVAEKSLAPEGTSGRADFEFALPDGPYSVNGRLVAIAWEVQVLLGGWEVKASAAFTLAPGGAAVLLPTLPDQPKPRGKDTLSRWNKGPLQWPK